MSNRCQNLIATVLHTPQTLSKITEPPAKGVKINLHSSSSLIHKCQNYFPYINHPLQVFSSSLLMKTSCLRLKLVELNFLVSFNTDDQSKTDVANTVNVITLIKLHLRLGVPPPRAKIITSQADQTSPAAKRVTQGKVVFDEMQSTGHIPSVKLLTTPFRGLLQPHTGAPFKRELSVIEN